MHTDLSAQADVFVLSVKFREISSIFLRLFEGAKPPDEDIKLLRWVGDVVAHILHLVTDPDPGLVVLATTLRPDWMTVCKNHQVSPDSANLIHKYLTTGMTVPHSVLLDASWVFYDLSYILLRQFSVN